MYSILTGPCLREIVSGVVFPPKRIPETIKGGIPKTLIKEPRLASPIIVFLGGLPRCKSGPIFKSTVVTDRKPP